MGFQKLFGLVPLKLKTPSGDVMSGAAWRGCEGAGTCCILFCGALPSFFKGSSPQKHLFTLATVKCLALTAPFSSHLTFRFYKDPLFTKFNISTVQFFV